MVWGTVEPGTSLDCLSGIGRRLKLVEAEITCSKSVAAAVRRSKPERIFHLAAQSHVPTSWADPVSTLRVNVEGTLNLLMAAVGSGKTKASRKLPRVLLVSSGDVYGTTAGLKGRIKESTPLSPLNPYAASKVSAEMMATCIQAGRKLPVIIVRPFNHIGPGQSPVFVISDFARQLARIEAGLTKPVMKVGDLSARKDFTDVRDMIRAYITAVERCPPGKPFNICSGKSLSIKKSLDMLMKVSGVQARVVTEKKRLRVTSSSAARIDSSAFRRATGWKPEIPLRKTLADILDYWRNRVRDEK